MSATNIMSDVVESACITAKKVHEVGVYNAAANRSDDVAICIKHDPVLDELPLEHFERCVKEAEDPVEKGVVPTLTALVSFDPSKGAKLE